MNILIQIKNGKAEVIAKPKFLVVNIHDEESERPFSGDEITEALDSDKELIEVLKNCLMAFNELPNRKLTDIDRSTYRLAIEVEQMLHKIKKFRE
jgi:hypothetical protein